MIMSEKTPLEPSFKEMLLFFYCSILNHRIKDMRNCIGYQVSLKKREYKILSKICNVFCFAESFN
ncbi:unnamed protein product [Debaryomyces tyrocola]|nr:unnamed protein product [Debaryomyces tyrocola]